MAEDPGIEGLFDSESGGEQKPQATGSSADALALAVALQKSPRDSDLARAASDYLGTQKRLVELQIRHVDEELRLAIAAAKRRRYSDRIRNTLATFVALLVLGLVLAAVRMTVEALRDHSIVVESFAVPADLAAQGFSGEAVADALVSRLAGIRETANRNSLSFSEEVHTGQAGAVRVEIPQTGISLAELEHFVHHWLGHEVFIGGVVREDTGGEIAVYLHIPRTTPIEVKGPRTDLDRLLQESAERAFESFDYTNYIIYLLASGRDPEAYAAAQRAIAQLDFKQVSRKEKADTYALLGGTDPDAHRAFERAMISIDLDPSEMTGWVEGARSSADMGHDQTAYDFFGRVLRTKMEDQLPQLRGGYGWAVLEARSYMDQASGDFVALAADYEQLPATISHLYGRRARTAAALHDELGAERAFAHLRPAGASAQDVSQALWFISAAKGDWSSARDAAQGLVDVQTAQKAKAPDPQFAAAIELALQTQYRPLLAEATLMRGDANGAARALADSPQECYVCTQLRARIAAASGDWAEANRWFAEAVHQAPQLPAAYWHWGESLLAAGKFAAAAQQLSRAHDKGPYFADPLKAWGDALVKQGQVRDALKKYDEALRYAPNWPALKSARQSAAKQLT